MTARRIAVGAVALILAGCVGCAQGDGRELRAPPPGATAPTTTSAADKVDTASTAALFALTSPAFADGEALPVDHTCDGTGQPPPLRWANPPTAVELALILADGDADGAVHWVVAGISPTSLGFDPATAVSGVVDVGYQPPCPAPGDSAHQYVFTLFALGTPTGIHPGMSATEAAQVIQSSPARAAQLTATYSR